MDEAPEGGDAFNKVPDVCQMDVDIRFLPNQDPGEILAQIRQIGDLEIVKCFTRAPAIVSRKNPYVLALREAVGRTSEGEALSVGRDGASDVISFLQAGVPAVEFGPIGGGHHGPHEWVSISSDSSSGTQTKRIRTESLVRRSCSAHIIAARPPFMSYAPRPSRRSPWIRGVNCSERAGTTS